MFNKIQFYIREKPKTGWVSSLTTEPESSTRIKTSMPATSVSSVSTAEPAIEAERSIGINSDTLTKIARIK